MQKAALITGASSGIGRATAKVFSDKGYFVYLMGRNKDRLEESALQCSQGAAILSCDLTDKASVLKRILEIERNPQCQLEVLVNNAGTFSRASTQENTPELWRHQFEVNLLAPVILTQLIIPIFEKNKKGSIINVSSTLGLRPSKNTSAYSAVKAALIHWTQSLALELGPHIRANVLCPGIVDTPIHSFHHLSPTEKKLATEAMASLQPLHRIGTPEDIAKAIYFLASDESSWTTGAVLSVDGGINLQ